MSVRKVDFGTVLVAFLVVAVIVAAVTFSYFFLVRFQSEEVAFKLNGYLSALIAFAFFFLLAQTIYEGIAHHGFKKWAQHHFTNEVDENKGGLK